MTENSYGLLFRTFRFCQRALRGTGLGNFAALRKFRDFLYRVVRPKEAMVIRVQNIKMFVDPSFSGVIPELLRDDIYEAAETKLFRRILKRGDVFVDIGGNIGYYTLIAADIVKDSGKIVTFEPEPTIFGVLKKNVEVNGFKNITLVPQGLSDRIDQLHLYLSPDNTGGHHMYDVHDGSRSVTVEVTTLDDYLSHHPMKINLIKMDIEGFEYRALRGMKRTLQQNSDVHLLSEFCPAMIEQAGGSPSGYLREIHELDFQLEIIEKKVGVTIPSDVDAICSYCERVGSVNLWCHRPQHS